MSHFGLAMLKAGVDTAPSGKTAQARVAWWVARARKRGLEPFPLYEGWWPNTWLQRQQTSSTANMQRVSTRQCASGRQSRVPHCRLVSGDLNQDRPQLRIRLASYEKDQRPIIISLLSSLRCHRFRHHVINCHLSSSSYDDQYRREGGWSKAERECG